MLGNVGGTRYIQRPKRDSKGEIEFASFQISNCLAGILPFIEQFLAEGSVHVGV